MILGDNGCDTVLGVSQSTPLGIVTAADERAYSHLPGPDEYMLHNPQPQPFMPFVAPPVAPAGPITSTGGSSTYYDIPLPQWLVARIIKRQSEGGAYIKTEELVEVAVGNDFDFGNILKSTIRCKGVYDGAGKAGSSISYEVNKITYSAEKIKSRGERR